MKNSKIKNVFIAYFVALVLFCGIRILSAFNIFSGVSKKLGFVSASAISDVFYGVAIQIVVVLTTSFLVYKLLSKNTLKQVFSDSFVKKTNFKTVVYAIIIGFCLFFLNIFVSSFFSFVLNLLGFTKLHGASPVMPKWYLAIDILLVGVLPGLCEEFLHRGLLLGNIRKLGFKKALLISSVLFGLMHLNVEQFFYATVLGYFMGILTLAAKSIWPAVIVHFINNATNIYLGYASNYNWFGGNFFQTLSEVLLNHNFLVVTLIMFAIFMIVPFIVMLLISKIKILNSKENLEQMEFKNKVLKFKQTLNGNKLTLEQKEYAKNMWKTTLLQDVLNTENLTENSYLIKQIKLRTLFNEGLITDLEYYNNIAILQHQANLQLPNLENMQSANLKNKSVLELILYDYKAEEKLTFDNSLYLIAILFLAGLITLFTFIWGLF